MTKLHHTHFISPEAELGKQEAIQFLRQRPEYLYDFIQAVNVAEEGFRPVSVPRDVVHFLLTILHAAADHEHEFALQNVGLSSLDNAIFESDAVAPDYRNLARDFIALRGYISQTINGKFSAGDFSGLIADAVKLASSPKFRAFSSESFGEIKTRNQEVKLRALHSEHESVRGDVERQEPRLNDWRARSYERAAQTFGFRGAFG